ncbi:MAG: methylamine dehydrogenase light chain [Pseudomonadales bacterium]
MNWFDQQVTRITRQIAARTSRRSFLSRAGMGLAGIVAAPLLPVSRAYGASTPLSVATDPGDPTQCDYWRYCAIDGFLCSCCGGTVSSCPPGTEASPVTWIGTCHNPGDGRDYIISYNDCCGKSSCGRCVCNRNEGDRPIYQPAKSNDINWCLANTSNSYHCSLAVVIGVGPGS